MAHTAEQDRLGACPRCDVAIPPGNLLISYETADGVDRYAECPDCGDPVHPTD